MTTANQEITNLEKTGAIAGIVSIVFYIGAAVFGFLPDSVARLMGFAFPLLWIIAFMGIYKFLKRETPTTSLEIGYIFGIIGAALACTFIVIQQANFIWHDKAMQAAASPETEALLRASFRGANRVQAGMDVAFDIFITISWILIGLNIARSKSFNRILGWSGSLIALVLLVLNMITFPTAPAEAGLIDAGPFLGLWSLVFYVWYAVVVFNGKGRVVVTEAF